ncbi:recombinase family protein [Streptomyces albus]
MDVAERPWGGCGKCLVGVRRLFRMEAATTSPERQRQDVLTAAVSIGGHIIGWADVWEVSGATDPVTRPWLGPWLRDEMGSYGGLVAAAVDRLGRNVVGCLNTGYKMRDEGKLLLTHGHDGPWNLDDPADENRFTVEAWGAQMELRSIQRRNRDATVKARTAGRPEHQPSCGFRYVRKVMNGRVDSVELHSHAAFVMRNVAQRILADPMNVTPSSEAARLNRIGELAPADHTDVMYGKPARGRRWYPTSLKNILLSEAALGYLMHRGKPVIDQEGNPVRLCEELWDRMTHDALKKALAARDVPFKRKPRHSNSNHPYLLTRISPHRRCREDQRCREAVLPGPVRGGRGPSVARERMALPPGLSFHGSAGLRRTAVASAAAGSRRSRWTNLSGRPVVPGRTRWLPVARCAVSSSGSRRARWPGVRACPSLI